MTDLAALAVVFGILGFLWFLTRRAGVGTGGRLRSLETLSLAPGRTLTVVRVGQRRLLLATTAQSVTQLAELDPAEWPAETTPAAVGASALEPIQRWLEKSGLRRSA